MSKYRKSIGRRRSKSLVGFASKDLCETIPKSLTPPERLLKLLEHSFRYALSDVQKEFTQKEGFDISTFQQKGTECWEKIRNIIEQKNIVKSAVAGNGLCEFYLKDMVGESNEAVTLLETESKKWSEQVSYYREGLKREMDFMSSSSYSIKSAECVKECQLYDYSNVMIETTAAEKKLYKEIESLSSAKVTMKNCLDLNKASDSNLSRRCEKFYHQNISSTPKMFIRGIDSTRRNIKPYNVFKPKN